MLGCGPRGRPGPGRDFEGEPHGPHRHERWEGGPPGPPPPLPPDPPGPPGRGGRGGRGGRRGWGGGWGGRGGWGQWGGPGDRMERGLLRYLLLDALRDQPKHGYEIIRSIEERTHGLYVPSPGTIYPTLQLLEDQGFVTADREDERRVYRLSETGRTELTTHADVIQAFWARFPDGGSAAGRHEVSFLRDELHDLARTVHSGLHDALRGGDTERVRRVRLALERCKNEIREIVAGGPSPEAPGSAPDVTCV